MAVNESYANYQLRRTLPKLSGNMMLDLVLGFNASNEYGGANEAYVKQAHLRPISGLTNYASVVDERLMDRPHQLNIKRFYEKTRGQIYEQVCDSRLASDWPMIIPPS